MADLTRCLINRSSKVGLWLLARLRFQSSVVLLVARKSLQAEFEEPSEMSFSCGISSTKRWDSFDQIRVDSAKESSLYFGRRVKSNLH